MKNKFNMRSLIPFTELIKFYPIGIILSGVPSSFNPNTFFPGTTWNKIPDDTYFITANTSSGSVIEKTPLIIKNENIQAFNPSVSSTGHSHSYTFENLKASGHGDRHVNICLNNTENCQADGSGSEHTHSINFGNGVAIEMNNVVNHTKTAAWIRVS